MDEADAKTFDRLPYWAQEALLWFRTGVCNFSYNARLDNPGLLRDLGLADGHQLTADGRALREQGWRKVVDCLAPQYDLRGRTVKIDGMFLKAKRFGLWWMVGEKDSIGYLKIPVRSQMLRFIELTGAKLA